MRVTNLPEYLRRNAAHAPPLPLTRRALHVGVTLVAGALVFVNLVVVERMGIRGAALTARAFCERLRFDLAGGRDEDFGRDDDAVIGNPRDCIG